MRTRSHPDPDVVQRRLDQLRAELATQWRHAEVAPGGGAPEPSVPAPATGPVEPTGSDASATWWDPHTHVPDAADDPAGAGQPAAVEEDIEGPSAAATGATRVPVPGRHAARRSRPIAVPVPEPLRGRFSLTPWHLALVAVGVALALAATCWWVIRSDPSPQPVAPLATAQPLASVSAAPETGPTPTIAASPSATSPSGAAGTVTVDVEGKVRRPGIAVLPTGSRVVDAIKAAGGARRRRDLSGLNLAAVLTDGQQLVVGGGAATVPGGDTSTGAPSGAGSEGSGTLVNLNTATLDELDTLPGVGPVTAQSILDWREENGGFTSVDELLEVDGIGPVTLDKLTPLVTV